MGSNRYNAREKGATIGIAYDIAVKDADEEYGHQEGYSGQINNSCGITDVTAEYKRSRLELWDFIERKQDKISKHEPCQAICVQTPIGNKNQIKTQVEHHVNPGTKRWITWHVVYAGWDNGKYIGKALTKGDAVKIARKYTAEHREYTDVVLEKHLENKKLREEATITYKKASNERDGEWVFFGQASN